MGVSLFRLVLIAVATILGASARYVFSAGHLYVAALGLALLSAVFWFGADRVVRSRPVFATWLYQGSYLVIFGLVAGSAALASWLSIGVPGLVADLPEGERDTLAAVILGAISTLVGAAWLDNAQKADGSLWPDARQRAALTAQFTQEPKLMTPPGGVRTPEMEQLYAAVFDEVDDQNDIKGWDLSARLKRAAIIKRYA